MEKDAKQLIVEEFEKRKEMFQDEEEKKDVMNLMIDLFVEGKMPKEAMGFKDDDLEFLYMYGYQLYDSGKFSDALQVFLLLNGLDPQNARYWFVVGACFHQMKEYEIAINYYLNAAFLDQKNPLGWFHAADCYLMTEDRDPQAAVAALVMARHIMKDDSNYDSVRSKIEVMLEALRKHLEEGVALDVALSKKGVTDEAQHKKNKIDKKGLINKMMNKK